MSVLDLFASALAAFILISVIIFPYYNRHQQLEIAKKTAAEKDVAIHSTTDRLAKVESKLQKGADELRKSETYAIQLKACKSSAEACSAALSDTFLIVGVEWADRCDVDLYVTDPLFGMFSFREKTKRGTDAELSVDMLDGPGIEVWNNPKATAGDYEIRYSIGSFCPNGRALVHGWTIDRSGGKRYLPDKKLERSMGMKEVATVRITGNGEALIEPASQ